MGFNEQVGTTKSVEDIPRNNKCKSLITGAGFLAIKQASDP